jgi:serine/threonine protein kinase
MMKTPSAQGFAVIHQQLGPAQRRQLPDGFASRPQGRFHSRHCNARERENNTGEAEPRAWRSVRKSWWDFPRIYPVPVEDSQSALQELLCQLAHQNLVKIFGADAVNNGSILLEMELVGGGSFQDVISAAASTGQWPSAHECIRLTLEAVAGLSYLHSRGCVHRDIKPANLVVRNSEVRSQGVVTDLGLASKLNQTVLAAEGQRHSLNVQSSSP